MWIGECDDILIETGQYSYQYKLINAEFVDPQPVVVLISNNTDDDDAVNH